MSGINLSDWAVRHRILILFFMLVRWSWPRFTHSSRMWPLG